MDKAEIVHTENVPEASELIDGAFERDWTMTGPWRPCDSLVRRGGSLPGCSLLSLLPGPQDVAVFPSLSRFAVPLCLGARHP